MVDAAHDDLAFTPVDPTEAGDEIREDLWGSITAALSCVLGHRRN